MKGCSEAGIPSVSCFIHTLQSVITHRLNKMANEEDALDELRSKSASISTKIKEIKAICVHCNRKVIEFVK